jgi:hypothetical protein
MPEKQVKPEVGVGRKAIQFVTDNRMNLAASAVVAGAAAGIAYVGGKAAVTTACLVGGGIFAVFFGHTVAKGVVETLADTAKVAHDKVKKSFEPPAGTMTERPKQPDAEQAEGRRVVLA